MQPLILGDGVLGGGREDGGERLLEVLPWHGRVEVTQRRAQARGDDELVPALPLPGAWRDRGAVHRLPHELAEDLQRQALPVVLGQVACHGVSRFGSDGRSGLGLPAGAGIAGTSTAATSCATASR